MEKTQNTNLVQNEIVRYQFLNTEEKNHFFF